MTSTLVQTQQQLRHNWQPAVHTRFGEKLYFYLLRLKSPLRGDEVEERIRRLLDAADISYACEYAVYGHWDVLIRAWLSPSWKKQFLFALRDAGDTIDDVRSFEAQELRYLWTGDSSDLLTDTPKVEETIAEQLSEVRTAAKDEENIEPELMEKLLESGLMLTRPQSEAVDPVKFYVCLKVHTDLQREAEVARVLDALDSAGLSSRASLYTGVGSFADHLIRCVADTYSEVMKLNVALAQALKDLDVRPMTLLVANSEARESDNVNDVALLSQEDDVVLGLLELNERGPALLAELPRMQREALHKLVQDVYRGSKNDMELREKLRDLLRASIQNDFNAVRAALVFLVDFEWFLTEYLKRAWAAAYGPRWIGLLAQEFESSPENAFEVKLLSNPEKWTLGDCVNLAIKSAAINDDVKLQLAKDLGQAWPHEMNTLKRIRNYLAHGKLRSTPSFDDFTGEWGKMLSDIMIVAALHFRIERLMTKEDSEE